MDSKTVTVALVITMLGLGLVVGIEALQISQLTSHLQNIQDAQTSQQALNYQLLGNITQLRSELNTQQFQQYISLPTLNGTITLLYESGSTVQIQQSNVSIILFDNGTCKFIASQPKIYNVAQITSP